MRITLNTGTPAELAKPADGRPRQVDVAGLVLWTDIFGLRPLFDGHAGRLADELGIPVIAPELYPGEEHLDIEQRQARGSTLDDRDKAADLAAAIETVGDGPVMTLGFCMGGMYAMKSLANPRVVRAVAFYGMVRMPDHWAGPHQADAIDTVRARAASSELSLLCLFGGDDPWCPEEQQDEIEPAGATVVRYPGAGHGWAQDSSREIYRPDDAADAWSRARAFLVDGA